MAILPFTSSSTPSPAPPSPGETRPIPFDQVELNRLYWDDSGAVIDATDGIDEIRQALASQWPSALGVATLGVSTLRTLGTRRPRRCRTCTR